MPRAYTTDTDAPRVGKFCATFMIVKEPKYCEYALPLLSRAHREFVPDTPVQTTKAKAGSEK